MSDETQNDQPSEETPQEETPQEETPQEEQSPEEAPEQAPEETPEQPEAPAAEQAEEPSEPSQEPAPEPVAETPAAPAAPPADESPKPPAPADKSPKPPVIPGAELDPIAIESEDTKRLSAEERARREAEAEERAQAEAAATGDVTDEPIAAPLKPADLAKDARYFATGKRKNSVARVIVKPGNGKIEVNGRTIEEYFPRPQLQTIAKQSLVQAGYEGTVDVTVRAHGGGISGQAAAVRHGISRALTEIDPALRGELKKRGFLTRDSRVKERRKAGLKKARKRPQFSKR